MTTLSVCIINHRTPELTQACVESVFATRGELDIEVLVVNNTFDPLDLSGFEVTFIQNNQPLAFAANQNQMLARATGRYLMPLNSDTVIHPGALQALVAFMNQQAQCGMAGPKLVHADGSLQPSCRTFPNLVTSFLESSGIWRVFRNRRWAVGLDALCDPHDCAHQVDWLTGACLIVRREAIEQAGAFDAKMFPGMYGEDMEWAWRIKKAGWQIWFTPDALVTHLENQSPLDERSLVILKNSWVFYQKNLSPARQLGVRVGMLAGFLPRWVLASSAKTRRVYSQIIRFYLSKHAA